MACAYSEILIEIFRILLILSKDSSRVPSNAVRLPSAGHLQGFITFTPSHSGFTIFNSW